MSKFLGNNKMRSSQVFFERANYAVNAFPREIGTLYIKPVSNFLFAERTLYGRINKNHDVIALNSAFLKDVASRAKPTAPTQALEFVVDAFEGLVGELQKQGLAGRLDAEDPYLYEVRCHNAYVSNKAMYLNYTKLLKSSFLDTFLTKELDEKITGFKSFLPVFFEFLEKVAKNSSVTKPAFIASNLCSPMVSGLSLNLTNLDPSDDRQKQKFLESPNFPYLVAAAKKYGFYIDQFVPWRLIADIGSPAMLSFAAPYGATSEDLILSRYFQKVGGNDIADMQRLALEIYNFLAIERKTLRIYKEGVLNRVCREPATLDTLASVQPLLYWVDKYIDIRYIEQREPGSFGKVVELKKNCNRLSNHTDLRYILTIINGAFKGFDNFEGSFAKTKLKQENNRDHLNLKPTY